jgi:hypothetical protein
MKISRILSFWIPWSAIILVVCSAHAETVIYTLNDVVLDDNDAQLIGTFSWTFDPGDFENGVGIFALLDVPFTTHDHTDLDAVFDIGNSIEITLPGSVHDDGVDITLFLLQPLTPTTSASIDLVRSQYSIGGNGFHDGLFVSGTISPIVAAPISRAAWMSLIALCGLCGSLILRHGRPAARASM